MKLFMLTGWLGLCVVSWVLALDVAAAPATVQVRVPALPVGGEYLGLGETNAPGGHWLGADSLSLYRDGQRWLPVMGEFHFSRYPHEEWRDALLKMKAGGVDIVSTYVFWIHHEEVRGEYDWGGRRSLRAFLGLCGELDLLAFVRMGPWCHGEVRNGGFPDWLQRGGAGVEPSKLRTEDPGYLRLVEEYYRQVAVQMKGLLWKDGGPVIGVQVDNESSDLGYLAALKRMAVRLGVDVPYYAMTGWSGVVPEGELLPLFGGYADGFWTDKAEDFADAFDFTPVRSLADPKNEKLSRYPYLCCEIGGGMASSYVNRVLVSGADTEALALAKLGSGNNLPGYYVFQGGKNPVGKVTSLHESVASGSPNELPGLDYDFDAPLGAYGQVRESYGRLRLQHIFLEDFGTRLAAMPPYFPGMPAGEAEGGRGVRWSVRSDGGAGFLFYSNHARDGMSTVVTNVQFSVGLTRGVQLVPREPVDMRPGMMGFWPVGYDFGGVVVDYATVQPAARISVERDLWFFFVADRWMDAEFAVAGEEPKKYEPGMDVAFTRTLPDGVGGERRVNFVVLPWYSAMRIWKLGLDGQERLIISANALLPDDAKSLRVELLQPAPLGFAMFPAAESVRLDGREVAVFQDGIFAKFNLPRPLNGARMRLEPVRAAKGSGTVGGGVLPELDMDSAAVWNVRLPEAEADVDMLMRIIYVGDVAKLYAGDRLVADQFCHGQSFDFGLWRLPRAQWDSLQLRVTPLALAGGMRLPPLLQRLLKDGSAKAEVTNFGLLERRRHKLEIMGVKGGVKP